MLGEAALWFWGGENGMTSSLWSGCRMKWKAAADGIVFVAAAEWQILTTKIPIWPPCRPPGSDFSPCQHSAMSPGCMLLFVFGFVGGAVVINSAILVSLSVLLLVHFSISTGVPALTQNLPRILRYSRLSEAPAYLVFLKFLAPRLCFVTISVTDSNNGKRPDARMSVLIYSNL